MLALLDDESNSEIKSLGFCFVFTSVACLCGLCAPNMFVTKANVKENPGDLSLLLHYESESVIKSPDFHLKSFPCGWS